MAVDCGARAEDLHESTDALLGAEWPRLVRLCAHLANDPQVAEDLAQETLVEAWRNWHKLRERFGHSLTTYPESR